MEAVTYLDTHVVVWLYAGLSDRFPASVRKRLESPLAVSPVVELELQYLYEVGRTTVPGDAVISELEQLVGLEKVDASLAAVASVARGLIWTRDPFDRLISAQAIADEVRLLTADGTILENLDLAAWE